jgi:hypothetical protein
MWLLAPHDLRAQRIGRQAHTVPGVVVRPGEDTQVEVMLSQAALTLVEWS